MIRTTDEAAVFGLWHDAAVLDALVVIDNLTTARYEPVTRNLLGTGVVDLLFEREAQSCVIGAIRLDPNSLITRERSPFIWPAHVAKSLEATRLSAIEGFLTPWLRSLARARPMARESIRHYAPSPRFDRARAAELLGAAPLERVMRRMAPFVYARRFAAGNRVFIDCRDDALGHAVLADLAASIAQRSAAGHSDPDDERSFARAWYGVGPGEFGSPLADDLVLADRWPGAGAAIVIETSPPAASPGARIEVPSPAPLDALFSFDSADAPAISCFTVHACEPPLRVCPGFDRPVVFAGSSGNIVLALSAEALAMHGADVDEAQTLMQCLLEQGFSVDIVSDAGHPAMAKADLVHIFGATSESHTTVFGQAARDRGVDYVFDIAPRPQSPSAYVETMLEVVLRAATDDAERVRYLAAYESRAVTGAIAAEPSAEEFARIEERFSALGNAAVAVLASEEDVDGLRALLPSTAADRVLARGVFAATEPQPTAIGHLVPDRPFAFVHGPICARSHALFVALAAQRCKAALVITGPCYDVEYLQTLRTVAPDAIVLADPDPGVVSALHRRAAVWVDAAPRPRSAGGLVRAAACGALVLLAAESPLARIASPDGATFRLTSVDECATALVAAIGSAGRQGKTNPLQLRLAPRRDLAQTFGGLMVAYARVASTV